ncbi:MAG: DUF4197 domain-containing protein [Saprospiraceae bacterium]|nr:DUF4197 domain-containing protein [Saprospiraceae bacterium]
MKLRLLSLVLIFALSGCAELQKILDNSTTPLTNDQIALGLKEALEIGVSKGSDVLSAQDGFYRSSYKILLPPEARKITDRLKVIPGFTNVEEIILEKINRGAEDAAKRAKPIFQNAIRQITFGDVMDILMGSNNAATQYLNRTTYQPLYNEFNPVIVESLNKFNAIQYWADAVNAYNKIPFITKVNPRLDDYVTTQALNGLFAMVEIEEARIRTDISQRTTDLLRRVFARQDANRNP